MSRHPSIDAVVIGGSAGSIEALRGLLPALPADFVLPIAVVLHIPPSKPSYLPQVLEARCAMVVKEAEDKEPLAGGTLYLAAPNYHLLIERSRCFSLSVDDPINFSRPSIDVLFETAADAFGEGLAGVLLTGANDDGARGMARIKAAGGLTIVQSPESAVVATMPEAAIRATEIDYVLPPAGIGALLVQLQTNPSGRTRT